MAPFGTTTGWTSTATHDGGLLVQLSTLSPPAFTSTMSAQPEIRKQKMRKSMNLARAVRISGGGQEGRHLANKGLEKVLPEVCPASS